MALIPEAVVAQAGVTPAPRAAAAGDTTTPTDGTYVHVDNANAASCVVTVVAKTPCSQGTLHDLVVTVPTGTKKLIGPINQARFADPVTGLASVNYSLTASVTVYAVRD